MTLARWTVALLVSVSVSAVAAPSRGRAEAPAPAPATPPSSAGRTRELGGHLFMPALGVKSPFTITSFGTYLTVGAGTTKGSITLQLPGTPPPAPQTFAGDVSWGAVGGVLGYEWAFMRNVSARILITETLYSGTTGGGVAVVGTNARLGGGLGLTAGLFTWESVRVGAYVDATYAPQIGLLLGPALKSAYDSCSTGTSNCQFDFNQLFEQKDVFQAEPGVTAAWALTRALGLMGNASYVYSSIETTSGGSRSQSAVSFGAAVDFDLRMVSSLPIGLQLTWNSLVPVTSGGGDLRYTDVGGGIFYTGRKDVSVALQLIDRRFQVDPAVDVSWSNVLALMGLRYYW